MILVCKLRSTTSIVQDLIVVWVGDIPIDLVKVVKVR